MNHRLISGYICISTKLLWCFADLWGMLIINFVSAHVRCSLNFCPLEMDLMVDRSDMRNNVSVVSS